MHPHKQNQHEQLQMLRRDKPPHYNQHQYSPSGWCPADMRVHGGTLILYLSEDDAYYFVLAAADPPTDTLVEHDVSLSMSPVSSLLTS